MEDLTIGFVPCRPSHQFEDNIGFGGLGNINRIELPTIHVNPIPEPTLTHLTAQGHPVNGNTMLIFLDTESLAEPGTQAFQMDVLYRA